ncbi:FlhC family transcriptional regulator [Aquipseudomonas alcaligenes]|uniref:FlhC family transcriptional regulator n=1 Tax=Aquipseudomonas alcaligenes TaxID=43263 RepID=UPI001F192B5E|nr:FlhC family transcriptional regulator [Pseudomonas alcaligenes]
MERNMEDLGIQLVKAGLRTAIIVAESGMTRKQITAARKRLNIRGNAESGPLPQAESLLGSRQLTLEASLFMHAYLMIAHQPKVGIDIRSVVAAHTHYLDCHASLRGQQIDIETVLDLDRAWVLARDYRAMVISMRTCQDCRLEFVSSFNDRRFCCPICSGVRCKAPEESVLDKRHSRTLPEYLEIAQQVAKQVNWGNTAEEIARDLQLNDDEFELARDLSKLSPREIRMVAATNLKPAAVLHHIRERGNVLSLAATPEAVAV